MPIAAGLNRQGFKVVTQSLSFSRGVLTKRSRVAFTFGPRRMSRTLAKKLLADAAKHGGKLGMRIAQGQRIRSLEVAGMKLTPKAELSREFHKAFGAGPREKWVGFPILGQRALLGGGFQTVLRIRFRPRARAAFQLVPIVVAFGSQTLTRHYVLGVSVLKTGKPTADVFVEMVSGR